MSQLNEKRLPMLICLISIALVAIACAKDDAPVKPSGNGPLMAANETSAVMSLRTIASVEARYQATTGSYGTLKQITDSQGLEPHLASGEKGGYKFEVRVTGEASYEATATPAQYGFTGRRSFYLNSDDAQVHWADRQGAAANASDPAL
ncbi:MAG: hypothetical protein WCB68_21370 [Pyrinomonadaceae bacterium]